MLNVKLLTILYIVSRTNFRKLFVKTAVVSFFLTKTLGTRYVTLGTRFLLF